MRQILFFLAAFALLASPSLAAGDFNVSVSEPAAVYAGNSTSFSVTVKNSGAGDWFSIAAIGTYSSWINIKEQNIFVPSGSEASSVLMASPVADAYQNKYEYSIIVSRASDSASVEKSVFVSVLQSKSIIIKDSSLSCTACNPGDMVTASVSLKNIGSRAANNMKLVFAFGDRTKVMPVTSIDYGSVKDFSTDFSLDPLAAPGSYNIDVKLTQDTSVLAQKTLQFSVVPVQDIRTAKNVTSSIFGNNIILTSKNYGNALQSSEITSGVLGAWYSVYSGAKPSSVKGSDYGWQVSLAPNESVTITYSEIFWPVPLLLAMLAFAGAYYYVIISSLSIRKLVMQRPSGKETSISLHVRSGLRPIDNAVVRDTVPKEFAIAGVFESIKPVVRKVPSGTELVWRLGRLKSNEERILHYKIKAVSDFMSSRLHPAELNGKRGSGLITRLSNYTVLHGEPKQPSSRMSVVVE